MSQNLSQDVPVLTIGPFARYYGRQEYVDSIPPPSCGDSIILIIICLSSPVLKLVLTCLQKYR